MRFFLSVCVFLFIAGTVFSASVSRKLHLNKGTYTAVDSITFPVYAFNETAVFNAENAFIPLAADDSLLLWVYNHDSLTHSFGVKNILAPISIPAGDSIQLGLHFPVGGSFIYYDVENYPVFTYLGAAGVIGVSPVGSNPSGQFVWNLKEHQAQWNIDLYAGQTVVWADYAPTYFTVNGKSKPHIDSDPNARITGNVGDTLLIFIGNTGQGAHSLHFHGYHASILQSSENPLHVGREKDTFMIRSMQTMTLQLVPDKPGLYPVHDHNLTAVTGGGYYPNGIFLIMEVF